VGGSERALRHPREPRPRRRPGNSQLLALSGICSKAAIVS
jgi:hypothetical protein